MTLGNITVASQVTNITGKTLNIGVGATTITFGSAFLLPVANISATGISNSNYLRGDGTW